MNALILAAGKGKRLRPLTLKTPKCLVKINGQSLLKIWIKKLLKIGVKKILINTHHLNIKVEKELKKINLKNISLIYEKKLLGTGGTLIKNIKFFENKKDTLLIHADNFCLDNLKKFVTQHKKRPKKTLITMLTFKTQDYKSSGIVTIDKYGIMKKMYEKKKICYGTNANGAVYIISPKGIEFIKKKFKKAKNFSTDIVQNLSNKVFTYQTNFFFIDIGTNKKLKIAKNYFRNND